MDFPGIDKAYLLAPKFCPLKCGAQILGKNFDLHVKEECPRRRAICPEGCGECVYGVELDAHMTACPMKLLLDRGDVACRESALRELKLAIDGAYQERERARARIMSRGEKDPGKKNWANVRCANRVAKIETAARDIRTRARRRAKEKLVAMIAAAGLADADAGKASDADAGKSALKYWDAFDSELAPRGSRPWDMEAPALQALVEAVEEAAICGADVSLRRRGESMLIAAVRRLLEACLLPMEEDHRASMLDIIDRARTTLQVIELEDIGDIHELLRAVNVEIHRATLRDLPAFNNTPEFFEAVTTGDVDLCEWLFDRERANPSEPFPNSDIPPLVVAAKNGDLPMCSLLILHNADVDARCPADGLCALHWASHNRSARTVALLLGARANPRLQDRRGQDSLMKIVRRDFDGPAEGCTWVWQVQRGRKLPGPWLPGSGVLTLETAKLLGENDPDCVGISFCSAGIGDDPAGQICVGLFAAKGNEKAVERQRAAASSGFPPFGDAEDSIDDESLWTSYLKIGSDPAHDVRLLLVNGADALATDYGGLTAMHHHLLSAPSRGSAAVVEVLLKGGADVNQRDDTERATTPLILAVSAKRGDLLRLMIKDAWPPADVDTKAADGTSALAIAEASGAFVVADILRGAGASAWAEAEVRLGRNTTFTFDTRVPPVPN